MSTQAKAQMEAQKARMKTQAIENQKRSDMIRNLKETCDYWAHEAQHHPNSQNLTYKAAACNRYRNAL